MLKMEKYINRKKYQNYYNRQKTRDPNDTVIVDIV